MKKEISILLDLGFGDSGKGLVTDYLTNKFIESGKSPLVVRFSGGHQAGHTVQIKEKSHIFSNYCAGTLRGAPSFFTEHCAIFPSAILLEKEILVNFFNQENHSEGLMDFKPEQKILDPKLTIDPFAKITTPYDIAFNRVTESKNKHGSCGLGITATFQRSDTVPLFAFDITNHWILAQKVESVKFYYLEKLKSDTILLDEWTKEIEQIDIQKFIDSCNALRSIIELEPFIDVIQRYDYFVFEGSQGILLDKYHGIYPHITYANTTSKNIWESLNNTQKLFEFDFSIFYITRCYQTRHGEGPMSEKPVPKNLQVTDLTNKENLYQGKLRFAGLDFSLLDYAIKIDQLYHPKNIKINNNLVVTCTDHYPGWSDTNLKEIVKKLSVEVDRVYTSDGPSSKNLHPKDIF